MCFPSKRQKNTLSDESNPPKKPAPEPTKAQDPQPSQPSTVPIPLSDIQPEPAPAPITTTEPAEETEMPKLAIVIYSMYGHIAKGASRPLSVSRSPTTNPTRIVQWPSP